MEVRDRRPDQVHFVGSVGLDDVEEVFRTLGRKFGRRLKRIPDGEIGSRRLWVTFQYPLLRASPFIQVDPTGAVRPTSKLPMLALAENVNVEDVRFGELGYAREARASYLDLISAKKRGDVKEGVRLQVCLPTPFGVAYAFVGAKDVVQVEQAYERAMLDEVRRLCSSIPHTDLSIQWDFCHEMIILDGQSQALFPTIGAAQPEIVTRMKRICAAIPAQVELGIHFCYGDFGAKHFIEPKDASRMVDVANDIVASVERTIDYMHFPVPVSRKDREYFRPFAELKAEPRTEIYLGVVHASCGAAGVLERVATAKEFVPDFGIATECGIARARTPDHVGQVLEVYDAASEDPR